MSWTVNVGTAPYPLPGFFCRWNTIQFKYPLQHSGFPFRWKGCTHNGTTLSCLSIKGTATCHTTFLVRYKHPTIWHSITSSYSKILEQTNNKQQQQYHTSPSNHKSTHLCTTTALCICPEVAYPVPTEQYLKIIHYYVIPLHDIWGPHTAADSSVVGC